MLAPGVIAGVLWRASTAFHLEIESACGFLKVVRTAEFQPEQEEKKKKKISPTSAWIQRTADLTEGRKPASLAHSVTREQKEISALHTSVPLQHPMRGRAGGLQNRPWGKEDWALAGLEVGG